MSEEVSVYILDEFIDRDPQIFRVLLNYLRSDRIDIHDNYRKTLLYEAQFFGIDRLVPLFHNFYAQDQNILRLNEFKDSP